jgi:hypothetical protein
MSVTYPTDLPSVPADRWGAEVVSTLNGEDDDGTLHPMITMTVEAIGQDEAERRALAVMDYDYQDDLRGARAEATLQGTRWYVTIFLAPYR